MDDILTGDEVSVQIGEAIWPKCRIIEFGYHLIKFEYLVYAGKGNIIVSTEPYTITKIKPKDEQEDSDKVD